MLWRSQCQAVSLPLFPTPAVDPLALFDPFSGGAMGLSPFGSVFGALAPAMSQQLNQLMGQGLAEAQRLRVDIREVGDSWVIDGDVPGCTPEEVKLDYDAFSNTISIATDKRQFKTTDRVTPEGTRVHRTERATKSSVRSIVLPAGIDASAISSKLTNGVLHITIPKVQSAARKQLPIN